MNPEKRQLLDDVLDDPGRRERTLLAGGRVLRRRRMMRVVGRSIMTLAVVICLTSWLIYKPQPVAPVAENPPPRRAISDEELLALFPDTPVAIATLSDGSKRLLFPRPGDEQKFVTQL